MPTKKKTPEIYVDSSFYQGSGAVGSELKFSLLTESGTQVRCQVQAQKHFMRFVEFGCENKNMGMWAGKNKKKRVGGLVSPGGMVKIN